jgi:ribonucleotide reductase alpha subunit
MLLFFSPFEKLSIYFIIQYYRNIPQMKEVEFVTKRDGTLQKIDLGKVQSRITNLCLGRINIDGKIIMLQPLQNTNPVMISQVVINGITNAITTSELDRLALETAANNIIKHHEYDTLATRIGISDLQKSTRSTFLEAMRELWETYDGIGRHRPLISSEVWQVAQEYQTEIERMIDYKRDYLYKFFGLETLKKIYLLKKNDVVIERPQHMLMRVSIGLYGNDLESIRENYELMSLHYFTHATPTIFNCGTPKPTLISCFLLQIPDDSIEGIYEGVKKFAIISAGSGGIGFHQHNLRSENSIIYGSNGRTDSIIKFLRVLNEETTHVNQGGRRPASFASYLETWHADFPDWITAKRGTGEEKFRARRLFYGGWISDLFMKRVANGEMWSLMSPDDCPGLSDCYGDEFETLYTKYEAEKRFRRQLPARDLMDEIITTELETGMPYMCFKDNTNRKTNQQNIGVIKSSNLCVAGDTLILTDHGNQRIDDCVGKNINIWNGFEWSNVTPFKTGEGKQLLHIKFSDGNELKCTDYHKFYLYNGKMISAYELLAGDELMPFGLPYSDIHYVSITSITPIKEQFFDTYCFTEPKRHMGIFNGILTGQCSEIMEVSSPDETACCVLGSLALPRFVNTEDPANPTFDYAMLEHVVTRMVKGLNNVIDRNKYSTPCAERSNMRHRPLGIGVQGLADLFFMFRTTFGEPLSKRLNKDIFEALYYYAVRASMLIAKEVGPYSTFVGSPMAKGVFQFDMWSVTPDSGRFDWTALKTDVMTHGIRNSLLIALMPTASTSQLLGNSECIEPYSSNVFARSTVAGTFQVVNKYLMEDLIKLDLWSEELCNAMIANNGSIQAIDGIPDGIKRLYKTAWEMDMKDILDMSADRGAYVCQSQSLNLFKEMPVDSAAMTGQRERLRRMYYYAWKIGLKTGQYYLRTRPAKDPIKVTLNVNNEKKRLGAPAGKLINRPDGSTLICTDSVCIMCE